MTINISYSAGDIVKAKIPFTNYKTFKLRPALVISSSNYNKGEDVVIVAISSVFERFYKNKYCIAIRESDSIYKQTGLKKSSVILTTKIFTISKKLILGKLGKLDFVTLQKVYKNLNNFFPIN